MTLSAPPVPDNDLMRYLRERGSTRNFKTDPIPDAWLEALLAAGQRAPTSSNMQVYSIVVVKDAETKKKLAEFAGNQKHIIDCPVFLALCADLNGPALACEMHGTSFHGQTFEKGLVAAIDASLVGMTISLAAGTMGLSTVMIGAMRNKPLEVAELLGLPPRVFVVFGLCVGWPKTSPIPKPRLPMPAVVHQERYDASRLPELVEQYNRELAQYYRDQNRETPDDAWTQVISDKYSKPARQHLRQHLNTLGFGLE